MDYYERQQYTAKIADVSGSFNEEVYVLLGGWERGGETAQFQVYINPFINWVWVGSIVLMLGFVMSFWKFEPEEKSVAVKTRTIKAAAR
jgi:cytochrome c-type biogenesis protein CcmF